MMPRYTDLGPSSRLRLSQFIPALREAGASVDVSPFFSDRYLNGYFNDGAKSKVETVRAIARRAARLAGPAPDVAWIEKELFPYLPGATERALTARGIPYVVDYDDAIFHNYDLSGSALVRRVLAEKLTPLIRGAAAITAGNPYLADYAVRHGARRVVEVPTVVDPGRYPVTAPAKTGAVRIGWIGTPANARYLDPVIAAMAQLAGTVPLELVTIGADPILDLPFTQHCHPWTEATEAELLTGIDIGVMPLRDSPWERGKCGYKLIQYMAAARPVIASPVGVNATIVDPAVGLLADTVEEWSAAIAELATDRARRLAMGNAARARVERHYSVDAIAPTVVATLADAIAAARPA
ncbi:MULTISPECIES: glycosyltransferase [unclassified Sphingomonas]|jgi:glycosyltransferase involved in cell wall biosynthesis|uniref:glycosyltransferase n=1 Tax=unclassified Sphingomonas TaxID=196159 RepID=UPI0008308951|nr:MULTISPECIES: glycosyltransferase [unclassified Sphingomonas]